MATTNPVEVKTAEAASDLSAKQFYAAKITSAGKMDLAGAGEAVWGIIDEPAGLGFHPTIITLGRAKAIYGASVTAGQALMSDASGKLIPATAGNHIAGTAIESGSTNEIHAIDVTNREGGTVYPVFTRTFHFNLADIANGDLVTNWTPGFAGRIIGFDATVTKAATTADKTAALNLEINATNLTGGVLTLTSANMTPIGAVVSSTAITAANVFDSNDTISIEASSVTAFVEGEVDITIYFG